MTTIQATRPYARAPRPGDSWWYAGCLVTSLAEATETAGQLSAVEAVIRKGMEPPPHTHTHEDEVFYIIAGNWTFQLGGETIEAPPGTFVWAPRAVEHSWVVDADGARALILTLPGGHLEAMFRPFSQPATDLALPPSPTDLPFDAMLALDRQLGVEYPEPDGG
jgi:quercetin dioxygenase-like cupin family protein